MSSRPLRTTAVQKPRTQGERIRYARIESNLSQSQLARGVSSYAKSKITKSLVSQWERDSVANPNNANMLGVQMVTGFAVQWLVNGRGPQRLVIPSADPNNIAPLDVSRLARAMKAANPTLEDPEGRARTVAALYDLLGDTPDIAPALLARFAATLSRTD